MAFIVLFIIFFAVDAVTLTIIKNCVNVRLRYYYGYYLPFSNKFIFEKKSFFINRKPTVLEFI